MSPADPRLVHGLLRLYPAGWRERYADEFAAVLTAAMADGSGRRRWRIAADAAAGAADAHLHPTGSKPAARPDRIRDSACVAFCAFALFCLAGAGFQKMSEDPAFTAAAHAHADIGASYGVVLYGAIAAALAVILGSLPVLLAILRQAVAGRGDLRRRLLVPPVAGIAWLGLIFAIKRLDHAGAHSTVNIAAFILVAVSAHAVAAVSAAALVSASRRADLAPAIKRAAWMPMTALSAAMVAVTVADLRWGLSLPTRLYHSGNGLLATSLPATWISTLAVMAASTAVAVAATIRAVRLARSQPPGDDVPQPA